MNNVNNKPKCLQNWVPPSFAWIYVPDVFCVEVAKDDSDIIEFISTGTYEISIYNSDVESRSIAALVGLEKLHGQILLATVDVPKPKITDSNIRADKKIAVYCYGVFLMPDKKTLSLLVSYTKTASLETWIPASLKTKADALLIEYRHRLAEFNKRIEASKEIPIGFRFEFPPTANIDSLLPLIPRAAKFQRSKPEKPENLVRAATDAISSVDWPSSRNGEYVCILPGIDTDSTQGLILWEPYSGPPAYPEIRWVVQRHVPQALNKSRLTHTKRPDASDYRSPTDQPAEIISGISIEGSEWLKTLYDTPLEDHNFQERIAASRTDREMQGFESIAWFQPYHSYSEDTWGIHIDARKLDDFALSLLDDFRSHRVQASQTDAVCMAFGLIYAHEMFHARVEAALSWLEVNSLQPRYLRYKQCVYDILRNAPEWLEEALANWTSWNWFQSSPVQALFTHRNTNLNDLQKVVELSLDLSPPGYRDWRQGHLPATWRNFTTQLITGRIETTTTGLFLPVDSILKGPLPYDLQECDIPLYFHGSGAIADRIQSSSAVVNVPARREVEKALRFFKHSLDVSGGKGSHQKWVSPDRGAFILPARDPVSRGVFKTFLRHLGIDKATYVHKVRPKL